MTTRYYTTREVATILRLTPQTVRGWARDGILPAYSVGPRLKRWSSDDLLTYLSGLRDPLLEQPLSEPPTFHTLAEIAVALRVSQSSMHRWIDGEGIPVYRLPRYLLFDETDILAWLASLCTRSGDSPTLSWPLPHLWTVKEVGKRLRASVQRVRTWIHDDRLPSYKLPRHHRVAADDLAAWLASKRTPSAQSGSLSIPKEFYFPDEVAGMLKMSSATIIRWVNDKGLPAYHIGRPIRIARRDFEQWMESNNDK